MPVVGRIAQADDDRHGAFHVQRAGVLVGDGAQEQRQLRRFGVRAFKGVGQVNVRAVTGQLGAAVAQGAADAQLRHRVGADHHSKPYRLPASALAWPATAPAPCSASTRGEGVLDDAEQIRPGADRRIERDDAGIGEAQRFAEPVNEQVVDQPHLGAHHLDRGVVDAGVLAQPGVVSGQEVLVEIEPGVVAGRPQRGGRRRGDDAQ